MANDQLLKEIGERVFNRRKALNLTQEMLAERINVSVQMISNLELGKKAIRPENLIKISEALETSTDYLLIGGNGNYEIDELSKKIYRIPKNRIKLINEIIDLCIKE